MNDKKTVAVLLAPILLGVTVFFVIPFGMALYYSLTFGVTGRFVGLSNYAQVLRSDTFRLALGNTLRFLALGLALIMTLSFGLALLMRTRCAGTELLRPLLLLPVVVGVACTVTMVQRLLPPETFQSGAAFWVLLALYLWKNAGYDVLLYLAGLNAIPQELYDSAALDGAGPWKTFRCLTLPMMKPTCFFVFVVSIINCFRTYREAFLLAGEHPHPSIYMLQHFLNNNFQNLNLQRLSVAAVCLLVLTAALTALVYGLQSRQEA